MAYECTVCGIGATIWTGSLFDCIDDEILLRHRSYESGTVGQCNDGRVTAYSTGVSDVNGNHSVCYILLNSVYWLKMMTVIKLLHVLQMMDQLRLLLVQCQYLLQQVYARDKIITSPVAIYFSVVMMMKPMV